MKNSKIIVDRPPLDAKEIQAGMNFGQLMASYQVMSKPFYKTKWFFGTAGMASIGLLVGGSIVLNQDDQPDSVLSQNPVSAQLVHDEPDITPPNTQSLIALNIPGSNEIESKETYYTDQQKNKEDDKKNTLLVNQVNGNSEKEEIEVEKTKVDEGTSDESKEKKSSFDPMDLTPRIAGKLNGEITRDELFDNKGLTTNADVSIIHFELHLIDGLGGKVFEEQSNQLNQQMKAALKNVEKGETIYFENIRGKTSDGHVVRLNPLRYVLLN